MATWREHVLNVTGPGILPGIRYRDWLSLLRANQWAVSPRYGVRALSITLYSLFNSAPLRCEESEYLPKILPLEIPPPLFILGHWRTGTTHLHHLLSTDAQFASPNVYQTVFPHTFLTTEARRARILGTILPTKRPMDNVKQSFDAPNEDEFVLCTATTLSPYMSWVFPRRADHYDRYLTLTDVPQEEIVRWKEALVLFLKKMTWKYERPLLIKSPTHTCRIKLLLDLFPKARFVHIHRHPFSIFPSTRHTNDALRHFTTLQSPTALDWDARIIRRMQQMYERFFAERDLIPSSQFHEIRYEDLDRDPLGEIRTLYERLNLPGHAEMEANLKLYLQSIQGYTKNRFPELSPSLRATLCQAWQPYFDAFGYAGAL
ncbi:MAG TPA: sulfotransferase [Chthonomonadaceae bacterium]|nr:sulfotransferase [Chthonomonadaceae bacterium]